MADDMHQLNHNQAYAITAGVYAVSSLANLDTILHFIASIVVIVTGVVSLYRAKK